MVTGLMIVVALVVAFFGYEADTAGQWVAA